MECQASNLVSHDLHDKYATMRSCCCVDAVDRVGSDIYCTLESKSHICAIDIIIDRLRKMDDVETFFS